MEPRTLKALKKLNQPILITGHTGFKGTWMALFLKQLGVEVIGYSLTPEESSLYNACKLRNTFTEKFCDINEKKVLHNFIQKHKPAVIFHLAAKPLVLDSYKFPYETFQVNALGTASILDVATRFNFIKVIGAVTTDKVYRNRDSSKRFKETDYLEGSDPYSESKVAAESAIRAWQKVSKLNNGPTIVSLRSGNVIGGGDLSENRLLPDIIKANRRGLVLNIRNKNSTRPWMHVLDSIYGYLLAAEKNLSNDKYPVFNFSPSGKSLAVKQVVEIANTKLPKLKVRLNTENVENGESKYLELDSTLARNILKWNPQFSQEQAIQDTVDWWVNIENLNKTPKQMCEETTSNYLGKILYEK